MGRGRRPLARGVARVVCELLYQERLDLELDVPIKPEVALAAQPWGHGEQLVEADGHLIRFQQSEGTRPVVAAVQHHAGAEASGLVHLEAAEVSHSNLDKIERSIRIPRQRAIST